MPLGAAARVEGCSSLATPECGRGPRPHSLTYIRVERARTGRGSEGPRWVGGGEAVPTGTRPRFLRVFFRKSQVAYRAVHRVGQPAPSSRPLRGIISRFPHPLRAALWTLPCGQPAHRRSLGPGAAFKVHTI